MEKAITICPYGVNELKLGAAQTLLEDNGTIIDNNPRNSP